MIRFLIRKTHNCLARFQAGHLALLHFKVDVLERPKYRFVLCAELVEVAQAAEVVDRGAEDVKELPGDLSRCSRGSREGIGALFFKTYSVPLGEIFYLYDCFRHFKFLGK